MTTEDQLIANVFNNVNLPPVRYNSVGDEPTEVPVPKRRSEAKPRHSRQGSQASQVSRASRKTEQLEKQVELRTTEFFRDANGTATRDEIITEIRPVSKSGSRVSTASESSDSTIKAEPVDSRGYNTVHVVKETQEVTTTIANSSNGNTTATSIVAGETKENKVPVDPSPIDLEQVFQGIPARQTSVSVHSRSSNQRGIGRHLSQSEQKDIEKEIDELDATYRRISSTTHDTSVAGEYNLRRDSQRSHGSYVSDRAHLTSQTEPQDHIYDEVPYEQHLQQTAQNGHHNTEPPSPPRHQRQRSSSSDYVVSTFDDADIQDKVLKEIGWKVDDFAKYDTVRSTKSSASSRGNVRITNEVQPTATYVSPLSGATARTLKTGPPKLPDHAEQGIILGGIGQRIQTHHEIGHGARVSDHVHLPPKQPSFRSSLKTYTPPTPAAPIAHSQPRASVVQRQTSIPNSPKVSGIPKKPTQSIRNVAQTRSYQKDDVEENKNIYLEKNDEVNISFHLCGRHEIKKARKHLKKVQIYEPIPELIPQLEEQFLTYRQQQKYEQELLKKQEEEYERNRQQELAYQQSQYQAQAHEPKGPLQVQLEDENNFSYYRKGHVHVEQPVYHKKEREMINFDELTALEKALLKRRLIEENHVENEKIVTVNLYSQSNGNQADGNGQVNGHETAWYNKQVSRQSSNSTLSSHAHGHSGVHHQHNQGITREHEQREIHGKHEHYPREHKCTCEHNQNQNVYDSIQTEIEESSIRPETSRPESRRSVVESGDLSDGTLQSGGSVRKVEHNVVRNIVAHEIHDLVICPLCQLEDRRRELDNESVISFPTTIYDQID
ncbi:unnamed protein product [Bursaphelenchus xylophilus]|uniref:(pine wood nematode) hypothetical protein n=1 Tax=Bursaphelenchus xylophilus TaxID=6326 RepID=A0A7I8WMJ0_BURXY|nr:unnamed protein product [Bursaphelenchus xylophilus]CAG9103942.1 unnamed protein product [Bursaphelenchus xylophilus]